MKRKIKVIDKVSNKVEEHEVEVRNLDHFNVQLRNKSHVFRDKTKYNRKQKYKNKF